MPENGTSGLMSGERKRSVAAWPKLPRLSSTLRAHAGYGSGVFGVNYRLTLKNSLSSVDASVSPTAE
jgi:hypothetical protein